MAHRYALSLSCNSYMQLLHVRSVLQKQGRPAGGLYSDLSATIIVLVPYLATTQIQLGQLHSPGRILVQCNMSYSSQAMMNTD